MVIKQSGILLAATHNDTVTTLCKFDVRWIDSLLAELSAGDLKICYNSLTLSRVWVDFPENVSWDATLSKNESRPLDVQQLSLWNLALQANRPIRVSCNVICALNAYKLSNLVMDHDKCMLARIVYWLVGHKEMLQYKSMIFKVIYTE